MTYTRRTDIKAEYIGIHDKDIPAHDIYHPILLNYIAGLIYNPILSMVKISILVFLSRLAGTKPAAKVTIWVLMTFTFGLMVVIFFCIVFVCQPISYSWNPNIKEGKCFPKEPFAMWTSSITIFTDLLVLVLPFWIFLGLRMARKAKIALLSVFALGFMYVPHHFCFHARIPHLRQKPTDTNNNSVTIIGSIRLFFLYRSNFKPETPDSHFSIGYTTTALETNLAVVAASGPALWPLARRWFPGFFSNLGLSRGYQGDIPRIETNDGFHDDKETTPASSFRNFPLVTRIFGKSRHSSRTGASGHDGTQIIQKTSSVSSGNIGFGVHTNHSIGGTQFALREMRGDKAKGRTEIRSGTPADSEEEIMTYNGVMLTKDYSVTLEGDQRKTSGATERSWWDSHRYGRGANRKSLGSL